jgi:hypothetical protein
MKISDITIKSSKMEKFFYWINPNAYISNYKTSKALSKKINQLLDDQNTELVIESDYTIILGDLRLWASNFPFAYGSFHKSYRIEDATNELIFLEPYTERWEMLVNFLNHEKECEQAYGNKLPDRATRFRLRQVVESAKLPQLHSYGGAEL